MYWVKKVKYLCDYMLELEFNDGKVKVVDLSKIVGGNGIFAQLKNKDYFKEVSIDSCGNSICWNN